MSKRLWKLLQINVIYANGKNGVNKKGRSQSINASFYMLLSSYPVLLLLALFYGVMTFPTWKVLPELFFFQLLNLVFMSAGLTMFYSFSTFFKSRDFEQYLYYPFAKIEVFYGKLFAVFIMFSPFLLISGALGFSFGFAVSGFLAAILQLITNVLLGILSLLLTVIFVFYIGTHKTLQKLSTFLLATGFVVFTGSLALLSMTSTFTVSENQPLQSNISNMPPLDAYYRMIQQQPLLLCVLILIVMLLCYMLFTFLKNKAAKLYLQTFTAEEMTRKKEISYQKKSLKQTLFGHNFNLLFANKQYAFMLVFMMFVPIFFLVGPIIGWYGKSLSQVEYSALFALSGVAVVLLVYIYPPSEHLYSLERENLEYIYALPLTKKLIFDEKKRFALIITTIPVLIYIVLISVLFQIGIINFLVFTISGVTFNYMYQVVYLLQDEKSPNIHWSTEMDLLQGGMQTFLRILRYYGMIIGFIISFFLLVLTTSIWMIELIFIIVAYIVLIYVFKKYQLKRKL